MLIQLLLRPHSKYSQPRSTGSSPFSGATCGCVAALCTTHELSQPDSEAEGLGPQLDRTREIAVRKLHKSAPSNDELQASQTVVISLRQNDARKQLHLALELAAAAALPAREIAPLRPKRRFQATTARCKSNTLAPNGLEAAVLLATRRERARMRGKAPTLRSNTDVSLHGANWMTRVDQSKRL